MSTPLSLFSAAPFIHTFFHETNTTLTSFLALAAGSKSRRRRGHKPEQVETGRESTTANTTHRAEIRGEKKRLKDGDDRQTASSKAACVAVIGCERERMEIGWGRRTGQPPPNDSERIYERERERERNDCRRETQSGDDNLFRD